MRVNSYTIFGDRQRWAPNFATNIRQHLTMYPGWTFWVHTDTPLEGGYLDVLAELARREIIKVTVVPEEGRQYQWRYLCTQMLWRMLPLWQDTEYVFCRDLDSILTPRQLQCVRAFIASGQIAHGINDNPAHSIPLMGGMCGFQTKGLRQLTANQSFEELVMDRYSGVEWEQHGTDQQWLMRWLWPWLRFRSLIHQIEGGNDRSMDKRLLDVDISDIPQAIRDHGDDFTNYIGAQGTQTDHGSYSLGEICDFYDEHSPACSIVREVERELGWNTTRTAGIFTVRNHSAKTHPTTSIEQSEQGSELSAI